MKKGILCLLVAILLLTQVISVNHEVANASEVSADEMGTAEADQTFMTDDVTDSSGRSDSEIGDGLEENGGTADMEAEDGGTADTKPEDGGTVDTKPEDDGTVAEPEESEAADQGSEDNGPGEDETDTADMLPTGQVDVTIESALILEKQVPFTISLNGQEEKQEKNILLKADGEIQEERTEVSFSNLVPGNYDLTVTAPGFADYNQTISVDSQGVSLRLMTGFVEGISYQGGAHPGVILIGDVTEDGAVDNTDVKELIDVIDASEPESSFQDGADLNGDGRVDLVDLQYLSMGYQTDECTATPEIFIAASAITVKHDNNTAVEGDLIALLENEGSVTLSPSSGNPISETHKVSIDFEMIESAAASAADGIIIETANDNPISRAVVDVTYIENGVEQFVEIPVESGVHHLLKKEDVSVDFDDNGNIRIHLGSQIAVKKVTLTISGMQKNNNLAEISKVEFVNGMENRIPEPEMDIPKNLQAEAGSEEFALTWNPCVNVTGYEVMVEFDGKSETRRVAGNSLKVTTFGGKDIVNNTEYTVRVQSVNGTWRSGYSEPVKVTPKVDKRPDKPDNLSTKGQYKSIAASWKKMKNTDYYNLYYKEKQDTTYQKIEKIELNSYTITGLEDLTEYTVYVTGVNEIGESGPSLTSVAKTTDMNPAVMPKYGLINYGEEGEKGAGIANATTGRSNVMFNSPLDTEKGTVWGTVDKDPNSYYQFNSWDDGGYNYMNLNCGLTYEFDQPYEIQKIALTEYVPGSLNYFYVGVRYWDEQGKENYIKQGRFIARKLDAEGRPYYLLTLPEKVTAKKIQIGLARYLASGSITVSEVYFYHSDVLAEDIMALYADDLHMELKPEVTQETIDALRTRLNTPDERCGEYNPDRELLERELKNAEDILNNTALGRIVQIHTTISTNDVNRGFGGLNAWQPIGVSAAAGESITVYVGHNTKKTGESTNLQLVANQYHSESSPMSKVVANLKVGMNIVEIPKLWSIDAESGGALYIQYTGNNTNDRYAVRTSGGANVPCLDLYQVSDPAERLSRAKAYIEQLREYTKNMESLHEKLHAGSDLAAVNSYDYNEKNCILGATDILMEDMMLSLPAGQVLRGCDGGSVEEQAKRLVSSMDAVEDMMYLFYQHKGLDDRSTAEEDTAEKDKTPKQHLNIRYQRMFAGAFMYASGNHIGIEWSETAGMMKGKTVVADSQGFCKSEENGYFGWGISHEIGHCINQGSYAIAEVTNNYFALLAQSRDTNNSVRIKYNNIYDKVTSGTTGPASNVFTQLGMYWQLHLAYDNSYNYKTYEKYAEQLDGIFFARVDTYARDVSKAPAPDSVALKLSGDREQDLMRLSCAAAEKNILEFFRRWGKTPDAATISYAEQFEEETRAIYYANDDARRYRLSNAEKGSSLGTEGKVDAVGAGTIASISAENPNQVDFKLQSANIPESDVLGYEIVRCMISGGDTEKEVVGFATGNTFSDHITTINNRVVNYEVTVIDKYLNRSKTVSLEPLKIQHDGSLDKRGWTIGATGLTALDVSVVENGEDKETSCAPAAEDPLQKMIDQDTAEVYTGTALANAEVVIEFNKNQVISGFKYTAGASDPITDYTFYVRSENGEWIQAAEGNLGESRTVYLENPDGKYVSTYSTDAVKLAFTGTRGRTIAVAELDVLGVTGDNVDFRRTGDGTAAIGKLETDYQYGTRTEDVIPAGSIVFTGAYKGNPAYNVVMLYDQDGNLVGGADAEGKLAASQIILADVPKEGAIQNVSDGTWIYWIEPTDDVDLTKIRKVRAELYRVNNAETNEGQRLVSDSLFQDMPETLPGITFTENGLEQ